MSASKRVKRRQGKVGSDPEAARHVSGKSDFGVPVSSGRTPELDYTSRNTKASDRGASQPRSFEFEGDRTHGAGGVAGGPGSSSGGDLDPDILGFGSGGGISASGPDQMPAIETDGTTRGRASAPPPRLTPRNTPVQRSQNNEEFRSIAGVMAQAGDLLQGQGADAASNPQGQGDDDAFAGEISTDEATSDDRPPSD